MAHTAPSSTERPPLPDSSPAAAVQPGMPVPLFVAPSNVSPAFHFHTVAGRPVVLAAATDRMAATSLLQAWPGVALPATPGLTPWLFLALAPGLAAELEAAAAAVPRCVLLHDDQGQIARRCGLKPARAQVAAWLIDRQLVLVEQLQGSVAKMLPALTFGLSRLALDECLDTAPVLVLPRVFDAALCEDLIAHARTVGGEEGAFMVERDGYTERRLDPKHKRRTDTLIEDEALRRRCRTRIESTLVPQLRRCFGFTATCLERYLVGAYTAQDGGWFKPHRDNTTRGTQHRAFAVTIELAPDAYEGGGLRFPEFGRRVYRAPLGAAVVFSCSLLHEALPVTAGTRHVFVPFIYGEDGVRIRQANAAWVRDNTEAATTANRSTH